MGGNRNDRPFWMVIVSPAKGRENSTSGRPRNEEDSLEAQLAARNLNYWMKIFGNNIFGFHGRCV